jgi:hypothetical protein
MLIWNVMGAMNLLWQISADADMLASFPETHRAIIEGRPIWATAGFAVCVFAGALGCFLLLLRKSAAYYLFIASLLGVIVTMIHTTNVASSTTRLSFPEIFVMILMPMIVAVFLIWYSKFAERKGWIN